jgi:glucosamine-6-phosphate isomerase
MTVRIFDDYEKLSRATAEVMMEQIRQKPDSVLCIPSGETPKGTFRHFVSMVMDEKTDLTRITFIGLDEWVGISPDNPGSCGNFIRTWLLNPLKLKKNQFHLFNGMAGDLHAECERMDTAIGKLGGLDFILIGIGLNGHIGLNEPGVSPDQYAHVTELAPTTRDVGQKYFQENTPLTKGITLGLRYLIEAGTALLIANGEKKASIIRTTVAGPIRLEVPSTIMHKHPNALIYLDAEAARELHNE